MSNENEYLELSLFSKIKNILGLFLNRFNLVMVIFTILLDAIILFTLFYMGNMLFIIFIFNVFYIIKYYYNLKKYKRESAIN